MNRFRMLVATAVVLMLSLAATAVAQEGGRGGRGGRGRGFGFGRTINKPTLLGSEQVRKELKIGEEQGKKVEAVLAAYREESQELRSGLRLRDLSDEEREKKFAEYRKKRSELDKKTEKKLDSALEKDQAKRLNEIALQQQGIGGLMSENVVASLKLSKEQVKKIGAARNDRDEKIRELWSSVRGRGRGRGEGGGRGGFGGWEEIREKSAKIRKDTEKTALATLSEEQREAFEKLKGKKFELDRRSLFRRGRGGRGGGFGGDRGGRGGGERRRPPTDDGDDAI